MSDPTPDRGTSLTLLHRLRASDDDAWRRLVQLYGPLVRYWCGRWGVTGPDAEDVAQELFQTVAARLADFRKERAGDTFRGWLRGITRNLLLAFQRRRGRQPQAPGGTDAHARLNELADAPDAPTAADDPVSELNSLYRRALELVRGEFEAKTWQMFWAAVVDGRPVADVADEQGVTPAAVRKAKSRVLHRLKEEVGELIQ